MAAITSKNALKTLYKREFVEVKKIYYVFLQLVMFFCEIKYYDLRAYFTVLLLEGREENVNTFDVNDISKNLLVIYCKSCILIGHRTHYLSADR
jgi:hypothetical protein